jgi:hypothetical protein
MKKGFLSSGAKISQETKAPTKSAESAKPATKEQPQKTPCFLSERISALVQASSGSKLVAKVDEQGNKGRAVFLTAGGKSSSIPAGQVIMRAECYATVVSDAMDATLCSRCFREEARSRCVGCKSVFCSDECLQEAGAEHAAECYALSRLPGLTLSTDGESARYSGAHLWDIHACASICVYSFVCISTYVLV